MNRSLPAHRYPLPLWERVAPKGRGEGFFASCKKPLTRLAPLATLSHKGRGDSGARRSGGKHI